MKHTILFTIILSLTTVANAGIIFLDDFEDGDTAGWSVTKEGDDGSHRVVYYNASNRVFINNYKSGKYSLSREFTYDPDYVLSFDMQALATPGSTNDGRATHAVAGVTVSFESRFNLTLGAVSFCFATSSTVLPTNGYQVPNTQESYEASFSEWAALANVGPANNIADLSIEFWATGRTADLPRGSSADADIYFDNVQVVPEPATLLLLGTGVLLFRRRRLR